MIQSKLKIRCAAMSAGVPMCCVARKLNILPGTLSRMIHSSLPLPGDEEKRILQAIQEIKEEQKRSKR